MLLFIQQSMSGFPPFNIKSFLFLFVIEADEMIDSTQTGGLNETPRVLTVH